MADKAFSQPFPYKNHMTSPPPPSEEGVCIVFSPTSEAQRCSDFPKDTLHVRSRT